MSKESFATKWLFMGEQEDPDMDVLAARGDIRIYGMPPRTSDDRRAEAAAREQERVERRNPSAAPKSSPKPRRKK